MPDCLIIRTGNITATLKKLINLTGAPNKYARMLSHPLAIYFQSSVRSSTLMAQTDSSERHHNGKIFLSRNNIRIKSNRLANKTAQTAASFGDSGARLLQRE